MIVNTAVCDYCKDSTVLLSTSACLFCFFYFSVIAVAYLLDALFAKLKV